MKKKMGREEIRRNLSGPVPSIRTPFNADGSIDFKGLRNYIDFVISAGSKTVMLTAGDSQYFALTDDEVAEVTRVVTEHTAGRAMVIAADRMWWTGKSVEFAKYARELGADILMVLPPDWVGSCTPKTFVQHYAAIAREIPLMAVTNVFIPRGHKLGLETIKMLKDEVDGVVAVKDDICYEFGRRLGLLVNDRWAVISGGLKQNHMNALPYGCDGYLSTFITFKPEISHAYWKAIETQNISKALEIIRDYDMPFFDFIMNLQGGYDAGMHGVYELFGIAKRWRRKPYYTLNDEEMEKLSDFLKSKSLL